MGQNGTELLVCFAQQDEIRQTVNENGDLIQDIVIARRYGLISWQDFLSGQPNYKEIK